MKLKSKLILIPVFSLMLFFIASCNGSSSSGDDPNKYKNPVWEPLCPDPGAIRADNGKYYAYATEEMGEWGKFGYCRLVVPILESEDLVTWDCVGSAYTIATKPSWNEPGDQLWAPDVCKVKDKYIMSYSLTNWTSFTDAIGIAISDSPTGPWIDQGKLFDADSIGVRNCIDSCIFVDDDERVYMTFGSFSGVFGIELTSDGLAIKEGAEKVLIAGEARMDRTSSKDFEASFLRKINGYYYLFLSTGGCCAGFNSTYHVVCGRSTSPLGVYYDKEGRKLADSMDVTKGTLVVGNSDRFVGVGHNAIVQNEHGDYYILYHGYDKTKDPMIGTCNRRCLLVDKLLFDEEGFPHTKDYIASESAERPGSNQ